MVNPGEESDGDKPADSGDDAIELEEPMEAEQELALDNGDADLPWLEINDDYEEPGVDPKRVIGFAVLGLLVLVLIGAAIWWFTRDRSAEPDIADGSTIEAPDEPYKTRPEDPGGREVEGTGVTSFRVAEGENVEGRVADADVPAPSIDRNQTGSKPIGVGVQVGAYTSRSDAADGWSELLRRYDVLSDLRYRIVEAQVDGATIYRLQAVAEDAAAAQALCNGLKAAGGDCQVKN